MRFGQTLESSIYPAWRDQYIDYAKLKKLLREDESQPNSPTGSQPSSQWTEDDEGKFVDELVNVQLEKVHAFHKETLEKLRDRTGKCEAKLDTVAVADVQKKDAEDGGNGKKNVPSESEKSKILDEAKSELDSISKETNELEKYSRINYAGFLKAVKKHDRKRGNNYRVRPLLQVRLAALPFNKEDYSPLLYRLSTMYSFIRDHMQDKAKRDSIVAEPENKSSYTSYKFWVHPDNLLEVKTMILRNLPVLVYNPQTSKIAEGNQPDPSITSIYFDSPSFSLYNHKVDHGEASSLRVRWYGQLNSKPELWLEKKTVHEDNTSQDARFKTKEKYVHDFLEGKYKMEKQVQKLADRAGADSAEVKDLKSSVEEVQTFVQENNLQPVLRANYTRTAFQIPGDSRVRVSLDTDLVFIREDALDHDRPCRDSSTWHRTDIDNQEMEYPFTNTRKGEINRFPFSVLEITLRGSKRYEWIEDIMHSHLVKEAPRFSKFVHGVAELFEDYVNTFPFWLSETETDIRRDPQQAFEEEQAKKQKEREDESAVGSLIRSTPGLSPRHRGHQGAIVSPIKSPTLTTSFKDPKTVTKRRSHLGTVTNADDTQTNETAEEPDEDETGVHASLPVNGNVTSRLADLFPSFSTSKYASAKRAHGKLPPGVSEPTSWIKDQGPVKVEAKVWLANQRTFIKWQHVSILLFTLGVGLFNAAGKHNTIARGLAIVYTCVALFTAAWGYGIYMWRSDLIRKRSGKEFDAMAGPIVVCIGLTVALVLNFAFKVCQLALKYVALLTYTQYRAAMEERGRGHSDAPNSNHTELFFKTDL
ncbi:hypothetical protein AMS68_007941 [Peltaster fructicola]|uniref:SPX domain-containing protein n=1 Tax=Peltaster fructicola TaxID=286661 RepID=A0A6H0Y5X6_9PEZI|nr:hypothetical protein AMS68_007941 [Peltaster fructicola]